jgi:glycine cleavage system regulatory protein
VAVRQDAEILQLKGKRKKANNSTATLFHSNAAQRI